MEGGNETIVAYKQEAKTAMIYDVDTLLALTPNAFPGNTSRDLGVLLALFRQFLPLRVLEFGIGTGTTASFLLDNCPFIVDYVGVELLSKEPPYQNRRLWTILADGTVEDFHEKLLLHVGDVHRYFDAIIMDANYDSVERDTEACKPFLRGGGLMFWRGYERHAGVTTYLDGLGDQAINTPKDAWQCPEAAASVAWVRKGQL